MGKLKTPIFKSSFSIFEAMKTASITEIKKTLKNSSKEELVELCLHLARFKKESKELLTYLLFEKNDESFYIKGVKEQMLTEFDAINNSNTYYVKKGARKILRNTKKHIRFSKKKPTEIELILFFCEQLLDFHPNVKRNKVLMGIIERELARMRKITAGLHEDLQYDYLREIDALLESI